jgi:hypothetical protein
MKPTEFDAGARKRRPDAFKASTCRCTARMRTSRRHPEWPNRSHKMLHRSRETGPTPRSLRVDQRAVPDWSHQSCHRFRVRAPCSTGRMRDTQLVEVLRRLRAVHSLSINRPGHGLCRRKPRPAHLKVRNGNPGKRPLNSREPKPPRRAPTRLSTLCPLAKAEWKRLAAQLATLGILSELDR